MLRIILFLLTGAGPLAAQQADHRVRGDTLPFVLGADRLARVDDVFADVTGERPGYGVGVVLDGRLVYARGFGLANLNSRSPITARSSFNVASLAKQFTAACVAILVHRGLLSLDDDVRRYIPELPKYPFPLRIEHLVYMTSGLPDYFTVPRGGGKTWSDPFTNSDAIAASLRSGRLRFRPGTRWEYSNVNYMLLAEIVARRSGVPFSEFARREIFGPLGMTSSRFQTDLAMRIDNPVVGYNRRGQAYLAEERRSPHYGGSGLFTSVEDLAKWSTAFETHALGGPGLTALLLSTRQFEHDKTNDAFGLVWGRYGNFRTLRYDGGDAGFSSHIVRLHDARLTVIVLSNLGTGGAAARARRILDALFAPERRASSVIE